MPFFLFLSFECFSLLISRCNRHTYIQHRGLLAGHHPNTILAHRCITQVLTSSTGFLRMFKIKEPPNFAFEKYLKIF
jgi:hypothetical protein